MMSVPPPAAEGTMKRTGFDGYPVWAAAPNPTRVSTKKTDVFIRRQCTAAAFPRARGRVRVAWKAQMLVRGTLPRKLLERSGAPGLYAPLPFFLTGGPRPSVCRERSSVSMRSVMSVTTPRRAGRPSNVRLNETIST